ncbi:MAG: aminoglycoside phosphotransferase family protein [Pseudomonadota bacterium]
MRAAEAGHQEILAALRASLAVAGIEGEPEAMADTGLAHLHFRIRDRGLVARLPKQSQMQLGADENLAYQAACYERASASGHAPSLHAVLPPTPAQPRGGLVVEEIPGGPAVLPHDLDAPIDALAAIHALPVPEIAARPPLLAPSDPLADLHAEIAAQAEYLDRAAVAPETRRVLEGGIAGLAALVRSEARPEPRLISFDAHPGNFILRPDGCAVLVDLEKCRYSAPELDLAHATLYTSTTWDVASHAVLDGAQVAAAYRRWLSLTGASADWLLPLRRAMWLWSMTWCAKWRVLSGAAAQRDAAGEDWSADRSEAALVEHVRGRVDHYLDPETATRLWAEFSDLQRVL